MEENTITLVRRKPCKCPHCGGIVVRIIYGEPTPETFEIADRGELVIGGCCINKESPDWECLNCHIQFKKVISTNY